MIYKNIKRAFDFTGALLSLIVLSPIFIVIAVGIMISDWGPIFYIASPRPVAEDQFDMFRYGKWNEAAGQ